MAVDAFVEHVALLAPSDPAKAWRLRDMVRRGLLDPNFPLPLLLGNEDELTGLPVEIERPFEYAIGQLLASSAASHWCGLVEEWVRDPLWAGCLQRPLLFHQLEILGAESDGDAVARFIPFPLHASSYLAHEAPHLSGSLGTSFTLRLAGKIRSRMTGPALKRAAFELFLLQAFGEVASSDFSADARLAASPIIVP